MIRTRVINAMVALVGIVATTTVFSIAFLIIFRDAKAPATTTTTTTPVVRRQVVCTSPDGWPFRTSADVAHRYHLPHCKETP